MRRLLLPLFLLLPFLARAQELKNPLGARVNSLEELVNTVVGIGFIPALGMAAFVSVLWGAFQWISAGGSKERIQLGRSTFLWVVLGLALAFAGYAILAFLISIFTGIREYK